jgi:hypothetical protein
MSHDDEQETFSIAIEDAGLALAHGSYLLCLSSLSSEQRKRTVAVVTALSAFLLSFKGEFDGMQRSPPPEPLGDGAVGGKVATPAGPGMRPNPLRQAVRGLGLAAASICTMLARPNRLTSEQRERGFVVLEAVTEFMSLVETPAKEEAPQALEA